VADHAIINVTVVNPIGHGYLNVWGSGSQPAGVGTMNYRSGVTSASTMIVPVASDGKIRLYTHRTTDVIIDVQGWMTEA
jgi:hypothetical protein